MSDDKFSQMMASDMAERLAEVLKENPGISEEDAMARVRRGMLRDNPFVPPEGCPVSMLPDELLAYIFTVGVELQTEELEEDEDEDNDDEEEFLMQDDGDDDWEDEDSVEGRPSRPKKKGTAPTDADAAQGDVTEVKQSSDEEEGSDDEDDDDDEEDDDDDEGPVLPFQVLVSHVCQRWRQVAIDTPDLWTAVNFQEPSPFEKSRAYVKRSKNRPLDIVLNLNDHEHSEDEEAIDGTAVAELSPGGNITLRPRDSADPEAKYPCPSNTSKDEVLEILDVIIPETERWRHFELETDSYEYIYELLQRLSKRPPAPELEVFQIYHYENCEDYQTFQPAELATPFSIFSGSAPKLEMLALWGAHIDWEACISLFSNLKDLELAYHAGDVRPSFDTFIKMISTSQDLRTLALSLSGPAGDPKEWPTEVVELPSVVELIISDHEKAYISQLMHILSFPNVKHLVVDANNEDFTEFALQLASPMPHKSRSILAGLETLKIGGLPCDENAAQIVLDQLSGLRELKLKCLDGPEETEGVFFQLLQRPRPGAAQGDGEEKAAMFCPRLEKLVTQGIDGHAMKAMVQARQAAGAPLKHLSFSDDDDVDLLDEKWLREHVETLDFYEPSDDESDLEEGSDADIDGDDILLPNGLVLLS
ncbi:hypothetical protein HDZ31DRAFT_30665 [Schizophyllum fasciatum]